MNIKTITEIDMQLTSAVIVEKKAELNLSHVDQHSRRFLDQILPLKLLATLKQLEALLYGNHIFRGVARIFGQGGPSKYFPDHNILNLPPTSTTLLVKKFSGQ